MSPQGKKKYSWSRREMGIIKMRDVRKLGKSYGQSRKYNGDSDNDCTLCEFQQW
jgi:hypothetical protein